MQKQLNKNKNFPQYEGTLKLTRIKGNIQAKNTKVRVWASRCNHGNIFLPNFLIQYQGVGIPDAKELLLQFLLVRIIFIKLRFLLLFFTTLITFLKDMTQALISAPKNRWKASRGRNIETSTVFKGEILEVDIGHSPAGGKVHPLDDVFDLNISSLKPLIMWGFCQAISMFKLHLLVTVRYQLSKKLVSFQRIVNSVRGVQVRMRDNMKITLTFTKQSK